MKEKGKTVVIDRKEETEESPMRIEEDISEEDPIQPMRQPKYMPPSKRTNEVPTNLDEFSIIITTPSLTKDVPVENSVVGHVATMKFDNCDLADRTKFPHLATDALMVHMVEGMVTTLQPKEWLRKVDEVGLLCLLAISHFLRPPITMLVIK